VDELGSGIRNTYKYTKIYSGAEPIFTEGDVFRTIIPLTMLAGDQASDQASDQVSDQVSDENDQTRKILEFCKTARPGSEIQEFVGIKSRRYFRERILNPLIKGGLLKLTIPDKPTSPKQKYFS
jgi:ATP-dependent DNA helicase RecG